MVVKKASKDIDETTGDVVIEDIVDGFGDKLEDKLKKIKKELSDCKKESKENLDGWQRLKADNINKKNTELERIKRLEIKAVNKIVSEILPALDSFHSAMKSKSWDSVDDVWKTGMEYVYNQFLEALNANGIVKFGEVGDKFDESIHEASGYDIVNNKGDEGNITDIVMNGYKNEDEVIRPAKVRIGKFEK